MSNHSHPLTPDEFRDIYSKVPRLTVEVVIRSPAGVLLTLRDIEPCRGLWHLPGGTVRFGEKLFDAVRRVAATELGIDVVAAHPLGYIEYPSHHENGLDSPVGIAFDVVDYTGVPTPRRRSHRHAMVHRTAAGHASRAGGLPALALRRRVHRPHRISAAPVS